MARDSEPACVGRIARSPASNNYDEPAIPKELACPYLFYYSRSASAGNGILKCREREFKDLKAVKRHMERLHIKHESCMSCGLRLGRDMNRHNRPDRGHCKGKNREPKAPQEATNLHKVIQNCKSMHDLMCAIIERNSNTIVYDYQQEPQAQPINIDEDEDVGYPADTAEVEHPTGDTVEEKSADTAHGIDENAINSQYPAAVWRNDQWECDLEW